jgi:hypothetical protein
LLWAVFNLLHQVLLVDRQVRLQTLISDAWQFRLGLVRRFG